MRAVSLQGLDVAPAMTVRQTHIYTQQRGSEWIDPDSDAIAHFKSNLQFA